MVARPLGLTPTTFLAAIRRGVIGQITERGVGDDAGWFRVTFRYRHRACRVLVSAVQGTTLLDERPA